MKRAAVIIASGTFALFAGACAGKGAGMKSGWGTSLHHALAESAHDRKPVFVSYANSWDLWCRRMDDETYSDREVKGALAGYHLVRLDPATDPEDTNKYDVYLCPSFLIVDHRGDEMFHSVGFRTPAQMMRELQRASGASGDAAAAPAR